MSQRKRPRVPDFKDVPVRASQGPIDPNQRFNFLMDEARRAMVEPDPLRGHAVGRSATHTEYLLILADQARP